MNISIRNLADQGPSDFWTGNSLDFRRKKERISVETRSGASTATRKTPGFLSITIDQLSMIENDRVMHREVIVKNPGRVRDVAVGP